MNYLETTPDAASDYIIEKRARIDQLACDQEFREQSMDWREKALERKYMHNFSWLGRPIIQFPSDVIAIQEIIWTVKPDLIIETGVAHGGSLILSASILQLLNHGEVIGIDIDIRPHNRKSIESHPLSPRITLLEGSSIDPCIIEKVKKLAKGKKTLVFLDSNHTHEHVMSELNAYSELVGIGSYCVVFDTFVEDLTDNYVWHERPWGKGNNPKTAVLEWLKSHPNFQIDRSIENKLLVTSAPDGFLRRIA